MAEGVLVCYRPDDVPEHARRLYHLLSVRLGEERVFRDHDFLSVGGDSGDFDRMLTRVDVVVVVVEPEWFTRDEQGRLRLSRMDPLLQFEVKRSLELRKWVISVLVDGAPSPEEVLLPPGLTTLARHVFRSSDATFQSDAEQLYRTIAVLLAALNASQLTEKPGATIRNERDSGRVGGERRGGVCAVGAPGCVGPRV